jgi:hypothetical protein
MVGEGSGVGVSVGNGVFGIGVLVLFGVAVGARVSSDDIDFPQAATISTKPLNTNNSRLHKSPLERFIFPSSYEVFSLNSIHYLPSNYKGFEISW